MIKWAGWLMTFYGAAHTLGALTFEGAGRHAGAWLRGALWQEEFSAMSPAHSAYWFSLGSFGIPLVVVGLTVSWLSRRGITPPLFIPCILGIWNVLDAVVLAFTPWPILLVANGLLLVGSRRAVTLEKERGLSTTGT